MKISSFANETEKRKNSTNTDVCVLSSEIEHCLINVNICVFKVMMIRMPVVESMGYSHSRLKRSVSHMPVAVELTECFLLLEIQWVKYMLVVMNLG